MRSIKTKLIKGFSIASGTSTTDRRFPEGSLRPQVPHFKKQGLDLDAYFSGPFTYGTLNLSFAPLTYDILKPVYCMRDIKWTDVFPPENFFLSPVEIEFGGKRYKGIFYIPDPSTKPDHFNPPTMLDVIAEPVPGISYGDEVTLFYNDAAIRLKHP